MKVFIAIVLVFVNVFSAFCNPLHRTDSGVDFSVSPYQLDKNRVSFSRKVTAFKKKNNFSTPNAQPNELYMLQTLCGVADLFGFEVRQTEDGQKYYLIDISCPATERLARKVIANETEDEPQAQSFSGSLKKFQWEIAAETRNTLCSATEAVKMRAIDDLKAFLNTLQDISHKSDDKAHTEIPLSKRSTLLVESLNFFDLSALSTEQKETVINILWENISNYSGFQRMKSVLIMRWVGTILKGEEYIFTKIPITCEEKESCFNCEGGKATINLEKKELSNDHIVWFFTHEISHLFHNMIISLVSNFNHYRENIPFLTDSILADENLRGLLFPQLSVEKLDFNKNPILRRIKRIIELYPKEFALLKETMQKQASNIDIIKNAIIVSIELGYGQAIFGDSWEECDISKALTPESLAKLIYISVFLTYKISETQWKSIWTENEEMLTILGITPFLFAGKYIVLLDKQHETIFRFRDLANVTPEEEPRLFRTHAVSLGAPELRPIYINAFVGSLKNILKIENFDIASTKALFEEDFKHANIFYPEKFMHTTDSRTPDKLLHHVKPQEEEGKETLWPL
jgi:hypothetical protein